MVCSSFQWWVVIYCASSQGLFTCAKKKLRLLLKPAALFLSLSQVMHRRAHGVRFSTIDVALSSVSLELRIISNTLRFWGNKHQAANLQLIYQHDGCRPNVLREWRNFWTQTMSTYCPGRHRFQTSIQSKASGGLWNDVYAFNLTILILPMNCTKNCVKYGVDTKTTTSQYCFTQGCNVARLQKTLVVVALNTDRT